eukprot:g21787.t1
MEIHGIRRDPVTCGSLIAACEKGSVWTMALEGLGHYRSLRNVIAASTAISACAKAQESEKALELLEALPEMQIEPTSAAFNAASICQRWDAAVKLLHAAKLAGIKAGSKSDVTYLKALERGSCWQTAISLWNRSDAQLALAIRACSHSSQWQSAVALLEVRCSTSKTMSLELWNAGLGCLATPETWLLTLELFEGLERSQTALDAFSYNLAIKACEVGHHWEGALALLREAKKWSFGDVLSYHMAMTTCMDTWKWEACIDLLEELEISSLEPNLLAYGPAVGACLRALRWEQPLSLLQGLWLRSLTPDTAMCNAVITLCERSGHWAWALELLERMYESGPPPDATTYNALINACATGSSWEAAIFFLTSQVRDWSEEALGATLRACSLSSKWAEALALPRTNLACSFAALEACFLSLRSLETTHLRDTLGAQLEASLLAVTPSSPRATHAVPEAMELLLGVRDAFTATEVASLRCFQAPAVRRLVALLQEKAHAVSEPRAS